MGRASVIIPSVAGGPRLRAALDSLHTGSADREVIVVDNGSRGGAVGRECEGRPGVEVVRLESNAGFSRAVNIAAERASGDSLVLVNDDCVCDPAFVEEITLPLDPGRGVVMAAGVLRDGRDHALVDTAGVEVDRTLLGFDYLNGEPLTVLDAGVPDPIGPSGGAAAFDRAAFAELGGFDERLFAYWEDVDLALRMWRAGGRCALAPRARATHEHSATLGSGSARKNFLMGFGRGYMVRKWNVWRSPGRLAAIAARDVVLCAGQAVLDRNLAGLRGRVRGFRAATPTEPYPAGVPRTGTGRGLAAELGRRAARRARLRRSGPAAAAGGALAVFHIAETSGPSRSLEAEMASLGGADRGPVEVVVPGPGRVADTFGRFADVSVLPYEALTLPGGAGAVWRAARALVRDTSMFRERIRARRPAVVIVVTAMLPAALIAARLERVPAVVYVGEMLAGAPSDGPARRAMGRLLIRATARLAAAVLACSRVVGQPFERLGTTEVATLYPPIQDEHADGDGSAFRRRHGIGASEPCVAALGAITRGRGQDALLRALPIVHRALPDARCVIAGAPFPRSQDRAYAEELRALAAELGVAESVAFVGFQPRAADVYAAADAFVNPASFPEPFGRAACEALLARTPVVATRVGAVPEVLRDGETALTVPPEDPEALAAAILRLLEDRSAAARLAEAGRADVLERFSPRRSVEVFRAAVERAAAGGPR